MPKNIILVCNEIWYLSIIDEDLFFEWIKRIPSIIKFNGLGDELYLHISSTTIAEGDLRELLALFCRYNIDMKQLRVFLNAANKDWFFENKEAYWHKQVF